MSQALQEKFDALQRVTSEKFDYLQREIAWKFRREANSRKQRIHRAMRKLQERSR